MARTFHEGSRRTTKAAVRLLVVLLLLSASIPFTIAQDDGYTPPRKFSFGLMGVAMRDDLTVYQGGARDADGNIVIKENDRLLQWAGTELKNLDDYCKSLYATKPGDVVEVRIKRGDDTLDVKVKLADPKAAYKELYTHLDKRKRTYDWRQNEGVTSGGPLRDKLWPLIQKHKLERDWDNLIAAQERELDLWDSYENLSSTDLMLSDPLAAHQWIQHVGDEMYEGDYVSMALKLLDREPVDTSLPEIPKLGDERTREAITLWRRQAVEAVLELFDVVGEDRQTDDFGKLCEIVAVAEFRWRGSPGFEDSAALVDRMRKMELRHERVVGSMRIALTLLTRQLESLWSQGQLDPAAFPVPDGVQLSDFVEGDAICFNSSYGLIAVGGPGRNVWKGGPNAPAVIYDIGGDDEYIDCATTHFGHAVSVVIDLGGNDHYRSTGKWGVACGMLGTAIIVDEEGDDTYECSEWGIGAAFGGIGLIWDISGNDRYLGGSNSIGCAAYGVGGVIDMAGNDVYDSHVYSIGCGQPGGVGFVLDFNGDDRYRCTGKQPSGYGTKGEWMGGGIGCGFGWRTLACGGIGLVVDCAGNDIYDAGEFGLGCGYFMGVGAVRDMGGDDIYHSSRYGLAAGAHAAVGIVMDDSGNDIYEGKTAASIAGVWDIATGYFYDGAGNDVYRCDGLGLGAGAQNAFGIFWDAAGADVYRAGGSCLGHAGQAEYSGGRLAKNFGIFMDTGGGNDSYRGDFKNSSEVLKGNFGLFLDE